MSPPSEAGLRDRLAKGLGACRDAISGAGRKAAETATRRMDEFDMEAFVARVDEGATVIREQLLELGSASARCTGAFTWAVTKSILGVPWRVWRFRSTLDGFRTGIVVPFVGMLKNIRANRDNEEEVARNLGRLMVFIFEAELKFTKMFATKLVVSPVAVPGMVVADVQAGGPEGIPKLIATFILGRLRQVLFVRDMTFRERLEYIIATDEAFDELLERIKEVTGWNDLDEEVSAWQAKHSSTEEAEEEEGDAGDGEWAG